MKQYDIELSEGELRGIDAQHATLLRGNSGECVYIKVVDDELHLGNAEDVPVEIIRTGRRRKVKAGESLRILAGDEIGIGAKRIAIKKVFKRDTEGSARLKKGGILASAAAAILLGGCDVHLFQTVGKMKPVEVSTNADSVPNSSVQPSEENPEANPENATGNAKDTEKTEEVPPKIIPVPLNGAPSVPEDAESDSAAEIPETVDEQECTGRCLKIEPTPEVEVKALEDSITKKECADLKNEAFRDCCEKMTDEVVRNVCCKQSEKFFNQKCRTPDIVEEKPRVAKPQVMGGLPLDGSIIF